MARDTKEIKSDKSDKPLDPIIRHLGDMGKFQVLIFLFVTLSKFSTGWVQLSMTLLAAKMTPYCTDPANATIDICSAACKKYEFDRSVFKENILSEFDLVCDRRWLSDLSQMILMGGIMFGNILFGIWADAWGRRHAFLSACVLLFISGVIVSFVPEFWMFCLFRFCMGFALGGTMIAGFVIVMECVGPSRREALSILYQIPFNLGHSSLPLLSYFLRHWRDYHLSFSVVPFVYLIAYFTVPESPRWLFTTGKLDKSIEILEKGAKVNGLPTETIRADIEAAYKDLIAHQSAKKGTVLDLFRHRNLCIKTIIMAFDWLVVCLTYYGIAQYTSNLSGNIFINVSISGLSGVPGTIACIVMTHYLGRKLTLLISNGMTAIAMLGSAAFPNLSGPLQVTLAIIGILGSSITFPNVYLYGGELFPTVVRNSGVGLCSFVGRVGSMIAPFTSSLKLVNNRLPPFIFGLFSLAAVLGSLILPETKGFPMPETIEDGEKFGKKDKEETEPKK